MAKLAMQTGNGHELALTEFYSLFVFCFEEPVLYVIYELERSVQVKKMCHQNCFEHQTGPKLGGNWQKVHYKPLGNESSDATRPSSGQPNCSLVGTAVI
jgi:hypothetical protein